MLAFLRWLITLPFRVMKGIAYGFLIAYQLARCSGVLGFIIVPIFGFSFAVIFGLFSLFGEIQINCEGG